MNDAKAWQSVDLHQSESRAGHLDGFVAGEMANERAGESSFAGAEIAG